MYAVIEMPQGTKYKYEMKAGILTVDRVLPVSVPFNYGFIPGTLCEDGDALDVFVVSDECIYPMSQVEIFTFAVIKGIDNGKRDDKLIATISGDYKLDHNLIMNSTAIIQRYLREYKAGFVVESIGSSNDALDVYEKSLIL